MVLCPGDTKTDPLLFLSRLEEILPKHVHCDPPCVVYYGTISSYESHSWYFSVQNDFDVGFPVGSVAEQTGISYVHHLLSEECHPTPLNLKVHMSERIADKGRCCSANIRFSVTPEVGSVIAGKDSADLTYINRPSAFVDRLREILPKYVQIRVLFRVGYIRSLEDGGRVVYEVPIYDQDDKIPIGSIEERTGISYVHHLLSKEFGPALLNMQLPRKRGPENEGFASRAVFRYQSEERSLTDSES